MGSTPCVHIILRRLAYGPEGFVCPCGGTQFKKERKKPKVFGKSIIRNSQRCKKCSASYIFVSRVFSEEAKL